MSHATFTTAIERLTALDRARIEFQRTVELFNVALATMQDVVAAHRNLQAAKEAV